ncbi:MAG: RNA 2',3'-cyclic phosphodiesterase [Phycisphaerales bacterium]|jgi:2'-5' RNA ligase|nr:RNA 2',3'-cyclic phosphodiesterase [Phycisphaerales bacterium]
MPFRLFIAAYPPPEVAAALVDAACGLGLSSLKPSSPEQVHITLLFIGDTDERQLDEAAESMHRAASGVRAMSLSVDRLIALPERGDARLIAADASAPPVLIELQKRLAQRLVRTRPKREREFRPHLTLGRFPGSGVRLRERAWPVAKLIFEVADIRLMASVLKAAGAEHREVARSKLESPSGDRDRSVVSDN